MRLLYKTCWCWLLLLLVGYKPSRAQQVLIDSIDQVLKQPELKLENRIMAMGEWARINFFSKRKEAVALEKQALELARPLKDGQYKAFTYSMLAYLYVQDDSFPAARRAMDSAMAYAERTNNLTIKGYVWYKKGWLQNLDQQQHEAVNSFFRALRLLKGRKAYNYEAGIYYELAGNYADWGDTANQKKYAALCLQAALRSGAPDQVCAAYQAMATNYEYRYETDSSRRQLLDSALYWNQYAIQYFGQHSSRMIHQTFLPVVALNTANLYASYYPTQYKDSALIYLQLALRTATETRQNQVAASCYGMMSDYAIAEGDYAKAEALLLSGLAVLRKDGGATNTRVSANFMQALSQLAEKRGNLAKALQYYKQYHEAFRQVYDAEKLSTAERLEAQYEAQKQTQALAALQKQAALNKKLNYFYVGLCLVSVLALLFLFRSYHFRLKATLQQQQLLEKEKEDAALQSRLKTEENKRLQLEKQEAELQARLKEEESMRLQAEQQLLQERQERLQKNLLAGTLQMEEKNELLQTLQQKIAENAGGNPLFRQINRLLDQNRRLDKDFEETKTELENIHPDFFIRLQQKAGDSLTRLDLKHCSYILMGLSNKEIAQRMGVAPKSILMSRYRIKQKLGLEKEDNLDKFISQLS
jgi:DNA-binding CsgD family transcriptional regulator